VTRQGSACGRISGAGIAAEIDNNVRTVNKIINKKLFYDIAFVAKTNNEFVDPMQGIYFHDVPKNGTAADVHHRLRFGFRFFGQPRPEAAGQNDCFHFTLSSSFFAMAHSPCISSVHDLIAAPPYFSNMPRSHGTSARG
jgi:hypothetical protein